MKFSWKNLAPHLIAVGVFLLITMIYCSPALQGKVLQQSDIIHWKGMAQKSFEYKETHGHFPLWTTSLFSGMPAYQVAISAYNPVPVGYLQYLFTLGLPKPLNFFFLMCISFYFLSQVLRVNYRIGILGSLAYAYMSFTAIIVAVGHETQALTMGYMPFLLGAFILVYNKKYFIGAALSALFTNLLVGMNHPQIVYYFLITAACMTIAYAIQWIRQGQIKHMLTCFAILIICGSAGVASNMVVLATTYDYSKATMRGGTLNLDTATNQQRASSGLPIDYAFRWSYGTGETMSLLIPNVYGGASGGGVLDGNSAFAKKATGIGVPEDQATQFAASMSTYWGDQPFTSGPVYLGAIICLLFVLGMFYLPGCDKWWILTACVFAILMSWGKNLMGFNSFLFDYMPLYNKFRAPSMSLVIPQFLFPVLGILFLQKLFFDEKDKTLAWKKIKTGGYVMLGIFGVAALLYTSFTYKPADDQMLNYITQATGGKEDIAKSLYGALAADRQSMFGSDLLRSLFFAGIAFVLIWAYLKNKVNIKYVLPAIVFLSSLDVILESRRYLTNNNFQDKEEQDASFFAPSAIDNEIKKDTGYYRVLNLTQDVFNDALTSYHHNSVGGYHPAKLSIYEDLLTYQLRKSPMNLQVLNMLNTKYVIAPGQNNQPQLTINPDALGACWLVQHIQFVKDQAAGMKTLDNFNPSDTAIVEDIFKSSIPFMPEADSTAGISLLKNDFETVTYSYHAAKNQFAVFSEIFYDRGWKAYIDDKEAPIVKVDYALRGLALPAGNHNIRFEFKPQSFYMGEKVAIAGNATVLLLLLLGFYMYYRKKKTVAASPVQKQP